MIDISVQYGYNVKYKNIGVETIWEYLKKAETNVLTTFCLWVSETPESNMKTPVITSASELWMHFVKRTMQNATR